MTRPLLTRWMTTIGFGLAAASLPGRLHAVDAVPAAIVPVAPLQAVTAQGLWQDVTAASIGLAPAAARTFAGGVQRTVRLDLAGFDALLAQAPREFTADAAARSVVLELPWPDGGMRRFRVEDSPVMEAALAAQFPELRTFRGTGLDDPTGSLRFDRTPAGFHAQVLSSDGIVYIDPYTPGDVEHYLSYFQRDRQRPAGAAFTCAVTDAGASAAGADRRDLTAAPFANGATLHTYRLALAATGEYTAFYGGTVDGAMAGMVTTMNRVNGIYERDLALHMNLVANDSLLIYTNGNTDPYTNNNGSTMLAQNQSNIDTVIGTANYDIGHVFSTGGGGVATLAGPCNASTKARGVTGSPAPSGDGFDVDYVAHEMGHQFGATHTFNGTTLNCGGGNRTAGTAYEVGSGSTIMGYAGICGAEDLQPHSDALFHAASLAQIIAFINTGGGASCAVAPSSGNTPPTVDAGADYTIPKSTPFTLTAAGSDANGDTLTYAWEEYDLGTASPPSTDDGTRPIFRPFTPQASPSRTFPKLSDILSNTQTFGELLPSTNRTMTFRVTARDNRAGAGGVWSDDALVTVTTSAGPFAVTSPNTAVALPAGAATNVTWNVAGTSGAPVNTANVKITLSTDGGQTFPTVLAASTANDGSESVTIPNTPTTTARIKVEAVGNIFFDVSNTNFTITSAPHQINITSGPAGTPNPVASGGGVTVSVSATDTLGHALTYAWSASCPGLGSNGTFGTPALATSSWTAPSNFGANQACTIAVLVGDGNGLTQNPSYAQTVTGLGVSGHPPGDFDGDGRSDRTVFRPSNGTWYELRSAGGQVAQAWGVSTDLDVAGDYDGDGKIDPAVFRPSNGTWYILQSQTGTLRTVPWGLSGDVPLAADVDGDGKADVIVWRPSTGVFYAQRSSNGATMSLQWGGGAFGDVPLAGDWDGDGKADVAVWRPSSGTWYVAFASGGWSAFAWGSGALSDSPITGDWNGDGRADYAVFRPGPGIWYVAYSSGGSTTMSWGSAGDEPIAGDFDGDGRTDITVWRPSNGIWYSSLSAGGSAFVLWGTNGDRAVGRR